MNGWWFFKFCRRNFIHNIWWEVSICPAQERIRHFSMRWFGRNIVYAVKFIDFFFISNFLTLLEEYLLESLKVLLWPVYCCQVLTHAIIIPLISTSVGIATWWVVIATAAIVVIAITITTRVVIAWTVIIVTPHFLDFWFFLLYLYCFFFFNLRSFDFNYSFF